MEKTGSGRLKADPVKPGLIRELHRAGLLSDRARDEALALLRPSRAWWTWADRLLILLGAALVLAGIIFFFAYNWEKMGRWIKFGLIEAAILACTAGAWRVGADRIAGKALLLSAAVLVGPLLAVYGQAYQTGADPYELFLAWAVLIVGWALAAEFAGLWVFWAVVVHTAAILFYVQILEPNHYLEYDVLYLALAVLNITFLAVREHLAARGLAWAGGAWLRDLFLPASLFFLTAPAVNFLGESGAGLELGWVNPLLWLPAAGVGYYVYRRLLPDLRALAYIVLSAAVVILTLIGRLLFEIDDGTFTFLVFGLIIVGVVSLAVIWLRREGRALADAES